MNLLLQAGSTLFLGRFHSLAVHLPMRFLVLAAILYIISRIIRNELLLKPLPLILFFGALGAIASVVLGWFLSGEGGYPDDTLFWHQWLGIIVAVVSTVSWFLISDVFKRKEVGDSLQKENPKLQIDLGLKGSLVVSKIAKGTA